MNNFFKEFQNRFNKLYDDYDFDSDIILFLSLKGSYPNLESVINECMNTYTKHFEDVLKNAPNLLRHCLESYKLGKISEHKREEIKSIVLDRINLSIHKLKEEQFKPFIKRLTTTGEKLQLYIDDMIPFLLKEKNDIEFELDRTITDYNNNTTNFWGRNKDKLIVPVLTSILTTLLTLILTLIITKYILKWL